MNAKCWFWTLTVVRCWSYWRFRAEIGQFGAGVHRNDMSQGTESEETTAWHYQDGIGISCVIDLEELREACSCWHDRRRDQSGGGDVGERVCCDADTSETPLTGSLHHFITFKILALVLFLSMTLTCPQSRRIMLELPTENQRHGSRTPRAQPSCARPKPSEHLRAHYRLCSSQPSGAWLNSGFCVSAKKYFLDKDNPGIGIWWVIRHVQLHRMGRNWEWGLEEERNLCEY